MVALAASESKRPADLQATAVECQANVYNQGILDRNGHERSTSEQLRGWL